MLTNSELFYRNAKKYQDARQALNEFYEKQLELLADKHGSQFYDSEVKRLRKERDDNLAAAKKDCEETMRHCIALMRENNKKRRLQAPSELEIRILQVLQMRKSLLREEFDAAFESLESPVCIDALNELAKEHGILKRYSAKGNMSVGAVDDCLNIIERELSDFVQYDTKKSARISEKYHSNLYGQSESRPLPKRPLFETKRECFETLGLNSSTLDELFAVVDAEGGNNE